MLFLVLGHLTNNLQLNYRQLVEDHTNYQDMNLKIVFTIIPEADAAILRATLSFK